MPYADPADQREYQRQWIARRRAEWIEANGPCVDCGGADDLEVDHADAATKVLSPSALWSLSAERRAAELVKCVVRCHDCHERKSTVERDRGFKPTKLTWEQVEEIRRRYAVGGVLQRELAAEYGVHRTHVTKILSGRNRPIA